MKRLLLFFTLCACSSPSPNFQNHFDQNHIRCTSFLQVYENDINLQAIKVLLREGGIEIQRQIDQGIYLSFTDPNRSRSEFMVTQYLAERLGQRYFATLLKCFKKNDKN